MSLSGRFEELKTLVLVVDVGHLSGAARILGLSTNAVSRRIMALESSLSTTLLHRTTRALTVTAEGRILYARARRALEELEAAEAEMQGTQSELQGSVRLAIPGGACSIGVLRGIGAILDAHPELELDVKVVNAEVDPVAGHFDVVLHAGSPPRRRVVARRLVTVKWQLAATPDYLERHGTPRRPEDLRRHRCLRMVSDAPQEEWHLVDARGRVIATPVTGSFEADDSRVLGDAVYAGVGIGVRPRRELAEAVKRGQLIRVLPRFSFEAIDLYALTPPGVSRLPRISRLLDRLSEVLEEVA